MARTLFTNVVVLDGGGVDPFPGQVLVDGSRIKAVAGASESIESAGAVMVDGGGATLMPGLVEAHALLSFADTDNLEAMGFILPEEHTLLAARHAKLMLDHGFTTYNGAAAAKARLVVIFGIFFSSRRRHTRSLCDWSSDVCSSD